MVYPTAWLEGMSVIIVEIAGARAMAPFFGTSLQVWTAQITVTLLFLALGYGLGGRLARRIGRGTLAMLFAIAGLWLCAYPLMRTPAFDFVSAHLNVPIGSLVGATLLFGAPLLMLGAVSPVLIAYIDARRRTGAGSAAGRLFFTNTLGGLAGGWLTAFVLVPYCSLRWSLVVTGVVLLTLAVIWVLANGSRATPMVIAMLLIGAAIALLFRPPRHLTDRFGTSIDVLAAHQSGIGLLQVMDYPNSRMLLINGVIQGEMDRSTRRTVHDFVEDLNLLSFSHHPTAKTALVLGCGAGLLPKELALRGLKVTVVDIEPRIIDLARRFFDLPQEVDVEVADARAFLRRDTHQYDLIFLDTYASESVPWYLLTTESIAEMKQRLNVGGRLLINSVSFADSTDLPLARMEAGVLSSFAQAKVYSEQALDENPTELTNVTLVAGDGALDAHMRVPSEEFSMTSLAKILSNEKPATNRATATTDDHSDLDSLESALRLRWRTMIWASMPSDLLWD